MTTSSAERARFAGWKWLVPLVVFSVAAAWLWFTPHGLLGKADAIGYAVCHRIDARSFHIGDRQIPLCARCSGMYLGVLAGLGLQSLTGRGGSFPRKIWLAFYAVLALLFAVDGVNSYLTFFAGVPSLYTPNNVLRLLTGTGMGLAISAFILPAFRQTIWENQSDLPGLKGWKQAAILVGLAVVIDSMVLTENPLLLYPLALISAAGVLVLLGMVYTMVWVMVIKKENKYTNLSSAWLPLTAGFGTALLQIFIVDIIRLTLTGSWMGFSI